jgi:hypothetical protein
MKVISLERRRRIKDLQAIKLQLGGGWYADAIQLLIEQGKKGGIDGES